MTPIEPFDLLGELPTGTAVLEASAGTGKTYTIAALVVRYVAEGVATLDEMLVITFGRMASQELRERVRSQLVEAERALAEPATVAGAGFLGLLTAVPAAELADRHRRIRDALASFDAATIATTHQFCQLVLRSLGIAGDTDARATLVENLDELVIEVVDDLYLRGYGHLADPPPFDRATALRLARAAVGDPQATLAPQDAVPGSKAAVRVAFAEQVRVEMERRKRRLGILSYDDLLSRLARALESPDSPARERMQHRWRIVLVDEFQDTDPVQWDVLDRAFRGHSTLVLIGDPKQAIYAFRGGDIFTYLKARKQADSIRTLPVNWRSDAPLVKALQVLSKGAALGDPAITVHDIAAEHEDSRLAGVPHPAPVRLRVVRSEGLPTNRSGTIGMPVLRPYLAEDLAEDVARLLAAPSTFAGEPLEAGDIAILMSSLKHAHLYQAALARRGVPSVVTGGASVLVTQAGDEWLALLEALEQPQRTGRIRAVALTSFLGVTPSELDAGGDNLTDDLAEQVRQWLDLMRGRGVAAVHESVISAGLAERVLSRPEGERLLTDLNHLGQVLHEVAHRQGLGLVALLGWLRAERRVAAKSNERTRRLDTDAKAVQLVTIHGSKGQQYPVVYLPELFNCWLGKATEHLFHEGEERRLDVGGATMPPQAAAEDAGEELRLTYVALTRAQSQVVTWFAPSWDAGNSGLTRLLFGRNEGEAVVPDTVDRGPTDFEVLAQLTAWAERGALSLEIAEVASTPTSVPPAVIPALGARSFDRAVDTAWRRTSYSGLIRAEEQSVGASAHSEPEHTGTVDEGDPEVLATPVGEEIQADDLPSPMEGLPAGATFGSLVHAVLEHADPLAPDLALELRSRVVEEQRWWSVDATPEAIAEALLPMHETSLGPLADHTRLVDIGLEERLRELDFEFPLAGGEETGGATVPLSALAGALRRHLAVDDPMRAYADRLENPSLGDQLLRGYLSGSIDVVLRVGVEPRYLVVDYKTNKLGTPGKPLTALDYTPAAMTEAMLHSHYPLQAMLYSVVLHRYLRWRQPGYDPQRHLGGVLYLYVRGMCGPETPRIDDQPCGVFSWKPPAALVVELSDLLDGRLPATGGLR
ncbi:MAG: UvrD-helicase domain-containing protein [Marmoricola sp.]